MSSDTPADPASDSGRDLSTLVLEDFSQQVDGPPFAVLPEPAATQGASEPAEPSASSTSGAVELRLVEAKSFGSNVDAQSGKPFACLFVGPAEPHFEQGIRRLEHETLGALEVFLVPIGPHRDGMQYEAVFT